jgi:hypothetical protein
MFGFFARLESRRNLKLLLSRKERWDRIFGERGYRFEPWGDRLWMVCTPIIDVAFGHDMDGDRSALLKLASEPYDERYAFGNYLAHWGEFIGIEAKGFPRDRHGRVPLSPEQQLDSELDLIERLVKEVFHDPRATAKAVKFIDKMNEDYNARYTG